MFKLKYHEECFGCYCEEYAMKNGQIVQYKVELKWHVVWRILPPRQIRNYTNSRLQYYIEFTLKLLNTKEV